MSMAKLKGVFQYHKGFVKVKDVSLWTGMVLFFKIVLRWALIMLQGHTLIVQHAHLPGGVSGEDGEVVERSVSIS